MSFEGTVIDGKVVFDTPSEFPEGTRVEVSLPSAPSNPPQAAPLGKRLNRLAGLATDLPADFADEHDHYIHGTPRRDGKASQ